MLGGGLGLSVPWVLAAIMAPKMYRNNADIGRLAQLSAAGGLVGTGTGLGAEALGRLLTRGFGPNFKPSQWHRDQDPHRWNSALRTAPIAVATLGGKALSTMFREMHKDASNDQDLRSRIAAAYKQVTIPDLKAIEHGQYQKGHFSWKGLGITIESAPGAVRRGVDKDGTEWSVKLKNAYGYIKGTTSAEPGDQMDVFMGPHPESEIVFVVDQNKQKTKTFDEHKCVVGCRTVAEAKELYIKNYSEGWTGFRDITPMTLPQFKSWLKKGDMTKPLAGQQFQDFHKQATNSLVNILPSSDISIMHTSLTPAPWTKQAINLKGVLPALKGMFSRTPGAVGATEGATAAPAAEKLRSFLAGGGNLRPGEYERVALQHPELMAEFPRIRDAVNLADVRRMIGTGPIPGAFQGGVGNQVAQTLIGGGAGAGLGLAENSFTDMGPDMQKNNLIANTALGLLAGNPIARQRMLKKVFTDPATGLRNIGYNPKALMGASTGLIGKTSLLLGGDKLFGTLDNLRAGTGKLTSTATKLDSKMDKAENSIAKNFKEPFEKLENSSKELGGKLMDSGSKLIAGGRPYVGGIGGAFLGNMVGQYFEDEKRVSAEEAKRQKRNRILLTLLGGAAGAGLGSADQNTLPDTLRRLQGGWQTAKGTAADLYNKVTKQANLETSLPDALKLFGVNSEAATPDTVAALKELAVLSQSSDPRAAVHAAWAVPTVERAVAMPLGGAALGGAAGGLIQMLRGHGVRDKKRRPSVGAGVGWGGVAGGLLGVLAAADAPRQGWNASPMGRAIGTVPLSDGLRTYWRMLSGNGADTAIEDALNAAAINKWIPKLAP
jgi:hypothetical protein